MFGALYTFSVVLFAHADPLTLVEALALALVVILDRDPPAAAPPPRRGAA